MSSSFTSGLERTIKLEFVVFSTLPLTEGAAPETDNIGTVRSQYSDSKKSGLGDKAGTGDRSSRTKMNHFGNL